MSNRLNILYSITNCDNEKGREHITFSIISRRQRKIDMLVNFFFYDDDRIASFMFKFRLCVCEIKSLYFAFHRDKNQTHYLSNNNKRKSASEEETIDWNE